MKRLRDWLDDDPRNIRGGEEKRLKSLSALLMKAASHDKKSAGASLGEDVVASQQGAGADDGKKKFDWDALAKELGINVDGYAHLEDPDSTDAKEVLVPEAEQRDAAATALCSVVRYVLSSVTAFWKQKPPWLFACLNLLSALPDTLGTGNLGVGAADAAGDRLSVLVARVMPPLEAMLRASQALADEWLERREAWFTGLRGAEDFDLRVPPPELMSYEEAEAAVANAAAVASEAIEFSTTDEALDCAVRLSVARSARLLATLCAAIKHDPHRLTREGFLAATPARGAPWDRHVQARRRRRADAQGYEAHAGAIPGPEGGSRRLDPAQGTSTGGTCGRARGGLPRRDPPAPRRGLRGYPAVLLGAVGAVGPARGDGGAGKQVAAEKRSRAFVRRRPSVGQRADVRGGRDRRLHHRLGAVQPVRAARLVQAREDRHGV